MNTTPKVADLVLAAKAPQIGHKSYLISAQLGGRINRKTGDVEMTTMPAGTPVTVTGVSVKEVAEGAWVHVTSITVKDENGFKATVADPLNVFKRALL